MFVQYLNMSSKNNTSSQQAKHLKGHQERLPALLKLTNLTNQPEQPQIQALKHRVEELQIKVSQLESKLRTKRRRIRRKSSEVDKRFKCEYCKRLYGSIVSLNLHLRIKHKKGNHLKTSNIDQIQQERNNGSESK